MLSFLILIERSWMKVEEQEIRQRLGAAKKGQQLRIIIPSRSQTCPIPNWSPTNDHCRPWGECSQRQLRYPQRAASSPPTVESSLLLLPRPCSCVSVHRYQCPCLFCFASSSFVTVEVRNYTAL